MAEEALEFPPELGLVQYRELFSPAVMATFPALEESNIENEQHEQTQLVSFEGPLAKIRRSTAMHVREFAGLRVEKRSAEGITRAAMQTVSEALGRL